MRKIHKQLQQGLVTTKITIKMDITVRRIGRKHQEFLPEERQQERSKDKDVYLTLTKRRKIPLSGRIQ